MNAFITGSRTYGKPRPDSDIDLVIRVTPEEADTLREMSQSKGEPVRYGRLNLILCTTDIEYAMWNVGTEQIKLRGPHTREEAKEVFDSLRRLLDLTDEGQSGGA